MSLFTLFMVTDHVHQYTPRTKYNDNVLEILNPEPITIRPKQSVNIPLQISLQLNDNKLADQSPYFILEHNSLSNKNINFFRSPIYINNKYNYFSPSIKLVNNSCVEVVINQYDPIAVLTNSAMFDLIII
jgi:hypothetical protein